MRWLAGLCLLPGLAHAQSCAESAGAAMAATYGHRDWDLSTPGPVAHSHSPLLSATCEGGGVWMGVDAAPGLRHSYGSLVSRGTLGLTAHIGVQTYWDAFVVSPSVFSNGVAHGFGLRLRHEDLPVELRGGLWPGRDPTLALSLVVDVARTWDPADEDGLDIGWRNDLRLRHGFEVGHFIGYRLEVGPQWEVPAFGLRAGTVTQLRGEATVQPMAVGFVDLPLGPERMSAVELSLGWTRRKGSDQPVGGVRMLIDTESPVQIYAGRTWGLGSERWWVADFGLAMMW